MGKYSISELNSVESVGNDDLLLLSKSNDDGTFQTFKASVAALAASIDGAGGDGGSGVTDTFDYFGPNIDLKQTTLSIKTNSDVTPYTLSYGYVDKSSLTPLGLLFSGDEWYNSQWSTIAGKINGKASGKVYFAEVEKTPATTTTVWDPATSSNVTVPVSATYETKFTSAAKAHNDENAVELGYKRVKNVKVSVGGDQTFDYWRQLYCINPGTFIRSTPYKVSIGNKSNPYDDYVVNTTIQLGPYIAQRDEIAYIMLALAADQTSRKGETYRLEVRVFPNVETDENTSYPVYQVWNQNDGKNMTFGNFTCRLKKGTKIEVWAVPQGSSGKLYINATSVTITTASLKSDATDESRDTCLLYQKSSDCESIRLKPNLTDVSESATDSQMLLVSINGKSSYDSGYCNQTNDTSNNLYFCKSANATANQYNLATFQHKTAPKSYSSYRFFCLGSEYLSMVSSNKFGSVASFGGYKNGFRVKAVRASSLYPTLVSYDALDTYVKQGPELVFTDCGGKISKSFGSSSPSNCVGMSYVHQSGNNPIIVRWSISGNVYEDVSGATSVYYVVGNPKVLHSNDQTINFSNAIDWMMVSSIDNSKAQSIASSLKRVNKLGSVLILGDGAFYKCKKLEHFVTNVLVTNLGIKAFQGCTLLPSVTFSGVRQAGIYAFDGCSSLTSISMGSLVDVPEYFASNCPRLTTITITNAATIGKYAFKADKALTGATFGGNCSDKDVVIDDYAFNGCTALGNVTITSGRTLKIGNGAFANSQNGLVLDLTGVSGGLPTLVSEKAFPSAGLTSAKWQVKMPRGVTSEQAQGDSKWKKLNKNGHLVFS